MPLLKDEYKSEKCKKGQCFTQPNGYRETGKCACECHASHGEIDLDDLTNQWDFSKSK
jgi:hypothetical protein